MKNKERDPMPPPDATPEEIGEFWTHIASPTIGTKPMKWKFGLT